LWHRRAWPQYSGRLHRTDLDRPRRVLPARRLHLGLSVQQSADSGVLLHSAGRGDYRTGRTDLWSARGAAEGTLSRHRDIGRALVAIRDHYLSAEIMGINLTRYRTLSFGLAAFFAGIAGALYAHYQLVVSNEGFGIERSILFLAMIIIGGTGSIMGTLMGTAFVVLLPESMEWLSLSLKG